jgi:Cof subfamily protein (haloacid dehalogenase superfamily)
MALPLPPSRPFRLIALDLDGTLLDDQGEISSSDAEALRSFAQSGGLVVLASGRMTDNILPFFDQLGLDGPSIGYNGALAREARPEGGLRPRARASGGQVILERGLPARYADELIDYTRREGFHLNYYSEERLYARDDAGLRRFADLYSRQTGAVFHFLPDLERFRGREPTKLIVITDPTDPGRPDPRHRDELHQVWQARWGSEVTIMRTNPEYLEFYHREASKGAALAAVAAHYGVERSLTLAFGDNYNDAPMLEWAGCGVAVANAREEVKAAADWVSPLTNNESAVAEAMARLVTPL